MNIAVLIKQVPVSNDVSVDPETHALVRASSEGMINPSDLNAIEEAAGYERLMGEFKYTQAELADLLGKSRSHLANTLRLLQLPPTIQDRVIASEITAGHARALLSVRDPEAVARRIVAEGLSVREVEALAAAEAPQDDAPRPGRPRRSAEGDAALRSLEDVLGRALGYRVAVKAKASGEGEIRIRYASAEERDALCRKLGGA